MVVETAGQGRVKGRDISISKTDRVQAFTRIHQRHLKKKNCTILHLTYSLKTPSLCICEEELH